MKVAFKSLTTSAAFLMINVAHAGIVNVPTGTQFNGVTLNGTQTYIASDIATQAVNALRVAVTNIDPTSLTISTTTNPTTQVTKITSIITNSPVTSFDVETNTSQIVGTTIAGGVTLTTTTNPISTGGTLSLSNFRVDLLNKMVYATVDGANNVGHLTNMAIWSLDNVVGTPTIDSTTGSSPMSIKASGLRFTASAVLTIANALGFKDLGLSALKSITDAGTIDTSVTATRALAACNVSIKTTQMRTTPFYDNLITIQNLTSNPATGWVINWTYDTATLTTSVKNTKLTQKQYVTYTAQPGASNATLAAGASTTASFRSVSVNQAAPTLHNVSASVAGQACSVSVQ